ncbi:MAG: hypothetical protein ABFS42_05940 [Candidatus Krumholzibacteriota bacterium]
MRFSKVMFTVFCLALVPMIAGAAVINEIRIDQGGSDYNEYFELYGSPGESLDGLTYVVIGDGATGSGTVETALDLTGYVIGADGYFLVTEDLWVVACEDAVDLTVLSNALNFENSDNVTHLLVTGFTGAVADDIDTDDDGVIDNPIWTGVVDCLALIETVGSGDLTYCDTTLGPDGTYVPAHAIRCGTFWKTGDFTFCALDTPGMTNVDICTVATEETSFGSLKSLYR